MAMYDRAPRRIPDTLQTLLDAVAEATGTDFNFVLMNFYQDGTHSISYHSDDEKFLGTPVSFGLDTSYAFEALCILTLYVPTRLLVCSMPTAKVCFLARLTACQFFFITGLSSCHVQNGSQK